VPTRAELKELAGTRLKEAKVLLDCGLYDGSRYLAGYVVELSLKARICRLLDIDKYPEEGEISRSFKIHNLDVLLRLAGLQHKFEQATSGNHSLLTNWSLVTEWKEDFRYDPVGSSKKEQAQEIIAALEDKNDGIFTWIKRYW
jgi:HEPN domain-containing protein